MSGAADRVDWPGSRGLPGTNSLRYLQDTAYACFCHLHLQANDAVEGWTFADCFKWRYCAVRRLPPLLRQTRQRVAPPLPPTGGCRYHFLHVESSSGCRRPCCTSTPLTSEAHSSVVQGAGSRRAPCISLVSPCVRQPTVRTTSGDRPLSSSPNAVSKPYLRSTSSTFLCRHSSVDFCRRPTRTSAHAISGRQYIFRKQTSPLYVTPATHGLHFAVETRPPVRPCASPAERGWPKHVAQPYAYRAAHAEWSQRCCRLLFALSTLPLGRVAQRYRAMFL